MKVLCLLSLLLASSITWAESTAVGLERLKSGMKMEIQSPDPKDSMGLSHTMDLQLYLQYLAQAPDDDDPSGRMIQVLTETENKVRSKKLQELCRTLAKQLREERARQEDAYVEKLRTEYTAAVRAGLNAKEIKDLDPLIIHINRLVAERPRDLSRGEHVSDLVNQGHGVAEFLRYWQDYMAGYRSSSPLANLQNLMNESTRFGEWLPRSEVLARLKEAEATEEAGRGGPAATQKKEAKAKEIIAATRTLADMKGSLEKLEELDKIPSTSSSYIIDYSIGLRSLQQYYTKPAPAPFDLGVIHSYSVSNSAPDLEPLRTQLILYLLPRVFGLGEADAAKPGETPVVYLHRIQKLLRDRSEWARLDEAIVMSLQSGFGPYQSEDRMVLMSYAAGVNQATARRWALAVRSFQSALLHTSSLITPEMIGERLDAIRKEHPEEYEQGVKAAQAAASKPSSGFSISTGVQATAPSLPTSPPSEPAKAK